MRDQGLRFPSAGRLTDLSRAEKKHHCKQIVLRQALEADLVPSMKAPKSQCVSATDLPDERACRIPVPAPARKIFRFRFSEACAYHPRILARQEGRIASRHERGTGCDGRESGAREFSCGRTAFWRTAKSCGPDTPTLVSSLRINSAGDGGKKARSPAIECTHLCCGKYGRLIPYCE